MLETLRKVSTSTIATQLYKRGFRQPQLLGVKPLSEVAALSDKDIDRVRKQVQRWSGLESKALDELFAD